jgi:hypothetical protein
MIATALPTSRSGTSSATDGHNTAAAVECVTPRHSIPTTGVSIEVANTSITTTTADRETSTAVERSKSIPACAQAQQRHQNTLATWHT